MAHPASFGYCRTIDKLHIAPTLQLLRLNWVIWVLLNTYWLSWSDGLLFPAAVSDTLRRVQPAANALPEQIEHGVTEDDKMLACLGTTNISST